MAARTAKRKPGRPALPAGGGKRYALSMRTTKELRDKLDQAREASGRSLAQEVEARLEQSFQWEETEYRHFGDRGTYRLMALVAMTLGLVETVTGKHWSKDPQALVEAKSAVNAFLDSLGPFKGRASGLLNNPPPLGYGERIAKAVLAQFKQEPGTKKRPAKAA